MARAVSIAAGALIALAGIVLVFLGTAYLVPHLFGARLGRVPVIEFLVVCLMAVQYRRWRVARARRRKATLKPDSETSPLGLTSGM